MENRILLNEITFSKRKKLLNKRFKRKKIKLGIKKMFPKLFLVTLVLFLIIFVILLYKRFTRHKTKICLCTIIKNENIYIADFIKHYKDLGYNHIYLYDNNDINGEKVEDVIKNYINDGYVTLIDYRGFRGPRQNPQMEAFYDCYEKYNKKFDWLSFFDIDEYLVLKPKMKIQALLENERYKLCPIVKISWILYSDNNQIYYENKSLLERFPVPTKYRGDNAGVKSIMRGNIPYYKFNKSYNPHYLYYGVKSCSTTGKFINGTYYTLHPTYEHAILNHYQTKTITEFINKMRRGRATTKMHLNRGYLNYYFHRFFAINDKTDEKVKIFNDAFNTKFE